MGIFVIAEDITNIVPIINNKVAYAACIGQSKMPSYIDYQTNRVGRFRGLVKAGERFAVFWIQLAAPIEKE